MLIFSVRNQSLKRLDCNCVATKAVSYPTCNFKLYGDWTKGSVTSLFTDDQNKTYTVIVNKGVCTVPAEVLAGRFFIISLYNTNGNKRITTNKISVSLESSGYIEGETPVDITPSIYEQLMNSIGVVNDRITNLFSLPTGSTTDDAEVFDIRIGDDGTTYHSAGDAVRGQNHSIKDMILTLYKDYVGAKTNLMSNNLFDKKAITPSKSLNYKTGAEVAAPTNCVSDFIQIDNTSDYSFTGVFGQVALYDVNKRFVQGFINYSDYKSAIANNSIINTAYYLRITILYNTPNLNAVQIEKGSECTEYSIFGVKPKDGTITNNMLDAFLQKQLEKEMTLLNEIISKNLFDRDSVTENKYINYITGYEVTSSAWCASDYIPIDYTSDYSFTGTFNQMALYNDRKQFVQGFINYGEYKKAITNHTVKDTAQYMRISVAHNTPNLNAVQIEKGSECTDYRTFGVKLCDGSVRYDNLEVSLQKKIGTVTTVYAKDYSNLRVCLESITPTEGNPYTVIVDAGTYDISSFYTAAEKAASDFRGLFIPDYCTLVGIAGKENTILEWNNPTVSTWISTLHVNRYAGLKNITVKGDKVRYAMHDDYCTWNEESVHDFEDCDFIANNTSTGYVYGSGQKGKVTWKFKNCRFISTDGKTLPFWNHNNQNVTTSSYLEFENCRFCGAATGEDVKFASLNTGTTALTNAVFKGCKFNAKGILLVEGNVSTYGAGIKFKVSGYGNNIDGTDVQIITTDGKDYSGNIDLF